MLVLAAIISLAYWFNPNYPTPIPGYDKPGRHINVSFKNFRVLAIKKIMFLVFAGCRQ
jgi:hypothetical protein